MYSLPGDMTTLPRASETHIPVYIAIYKIPYPIRHWELYVDDDEEVGKRTYRALYAVTGWKKYIDVGSDDPRTSRHAHHLQELFFLYMIRREDVQRLAGFARQPFIPDNEHWSSQSYVMELLAIMEARKVADVMDQSYMSRKMELDDKRDGMF